MDREKIRARVEQATNLSSLPDIALRITEMVDSPETSARDLGAEISKDQVISAKVLKLVNSGFYGFSQPISTISHAVTLLGFNAVKSLVLSSSVLDMMGEALPGLWEHSLACARTCGMLAEYAELPEPEEVSTIGLLHDLGKVVLHQTMSGDFNRVQLRVDKKDMLFYRAEHEVLGIDHGTIGGWLLEKWSLPAKLVEPITDHHDLRSGRDHAERTAVLHMADVLCRAEAFGSGGDRKIPRLEGEALTLLDMTIQDVAQIMDRMNAELSDIPRL